MATRAIVSIKLGDIAPDPDQPRKVFDADGIEELAASMEKNGLLTPITVMRQGDVYIIIAGERRFRAATSLGWETIDAIVFEGAAEKAKCLQLLENIVRRDLNPVEKARAYQEFMNRGYTLQEIADILGTGAGQITWAMGVLKAREDVQHMVSQGQMTITVGVSLGKLTLNGQARALRVMNENPLQPMECVKLCDQLWGQENAVDMFPANTVQVLSDREVEVRGKVRTAMEKAVRAVDELNEIEDADPGTISASLLGELETQEQRMDLLIKALRRVKDSLTNRRVAMLGGVA